MLEIFREYKPDMKKMRGAGWDYFDQSDCREVPYIDHTNDGRQITGGTEDFSMQRWNKVERRVVYMKTGKKDRGGHDRWEEVRSIYARSAADCGKIARLLYPGQEISLRKY